jgi:hexosaminidase
VLKPDFYLDKSKNALNKMKNKFSIVLFLFFPLFFVSCKTTSPTAEEKQVINLTGSFSNIIPKPVSVAPENSLFILDKNTNIYVKPVNSETMFIGNYLAEKMRPSTGYSLPLLMSDDSSGRRNIYLTINEIYKSTGEEGYELTVTEEQINLLANTPAGLFRGVQTIRQIFAPSIESSEIQSGLWKIPTGTVIDYPRFRWRGIMLDVARHFFVVDVVKSYIDLAALYKINYFHIHLSDDQGWRIQINTWPRLTAYGGSTAVGGGSGGYYTQAEYSEIVKYAQERFITVVPEIDMPGHTNAALASYPELTFDGTAPTLYAGIEVGFSALDIKKDITYKFVNDVIKELSAITPGPYIHIGGDEAPKIDSLEYVKFIDSVQSIVHSYGKEMIGWDEISKANLSSGTITQHWANDIILNAVKQGVKVIMSPASKTYLDMKYDSTTTLGLFWAGYVEVKDAYNWDPATQIKGISENDIIGIEAPLWSETIVDLNDIEYMAFPRLAGEAEIGWSQIKGRNWEEYKKRLAEQGLRWKEMGVNFYHSSQVLWK